jgi:transcriptional regulator with XRE-family HTH domain
MTYQEWLEQKFSDWDKSQPARQSYYNFARYLDVNHTALAQWMSGVSKPAGDDLAKIAGKLGSEIYALVGAVAPSAQGQVLASSFNLLPSAMRSRLAGAIQECGQAISQNDLAPDSDEAKRLAVKIFDKWGFRIIG